jgi:drug/metabolite transporter (DMT)-like permease
MDPSAGYLLTLLVNMGATMAFALLPVPGAHAGHSGCLAVFLFVLAGLSTTLLGRALYFESIFRVGPSRASAWKNASPLYTLVGAALLLGERPSRSVIGGVLLTLTGIVLLAREQVALEQSRSGDGARGRLHVGLPQNAAWMGVLLGVGSGLAFASGMMLRKAALNLWGDPLVGSALGAAAACVGWLPFSVRRGEAMALLRTCLPRMRYFLLAGAASSTAQILTFFSLRLAPAAVTHTVFSLEPLFTLVMSHALLGNREHLTPAMAGAVALICCGVGLVGL